MLQNHSEVFLPKVGYADSCLIYVEGARDQAVIHAWSRLLVPKLAQRIADSFVILGGRRPERAREHFHAARTSDTNLLGLCILDRDTEDVDLIAHAEEGLEFFTWGLRHIESYLLVPDAIRRTLRFSETDRRFVRAMRSHLGGFGDDAALRNLNAKRLLAHKGELASELGCEISIERLARSLRAQELHKDVHHLFQTLEMRFFSL